MKEENLIAKALAIINRHREKSEPVKPVKVLPVYSPPVNTIASRIREFWWRVLGINIDAKRRDLEPLEDHLERDIFKQPTPLVSDILAQWTPCPSPQASDESGCVHQSPHLTSRE